MSMRFGVLQRLNLVVSEALPFVDLSKVDRRWSMAALLSSCAHLIFSIVKTSNMASGDGDYLAPPDIPGCR